MANAKTVLAVDVDDKAFRRFLADYQKFDTSVKHMPAQWTKITNQMKASMQQFNALLQQNANLTARVTHQHAQISGHAKHSAHWFDRMSHSAGKMKDHVASITKNILQWTGIGSIFGSLLGLGGFMGIGRLAERAAEWRKSSTSIGFAPNEMKAFQGAYNPALNTGHFMGGVSTAMADDTSRERVGIEALLGVGFTHGKSGGQIAVALAEKIREQTKGLSEGEIANWLKYNDMEGFTDAGGVRGLRANPNAAGDYARKAEKFKVDDKSLANWTKLVQAWEEAAEWIESTLIKRLSGLTTPLTKLTAAFSKLVVSLIEGKGFEHAINWVTKQLEALATWFESGDAKKDIAEWTAKVGRAIDAMVKFATDMAVIADWVARKLGLKHDPLPPGMRLVEDPDGLEMVVPEEHHRLGSQHLTTRSGWRKFLDWWNPGGNTNAPTPDFTPDQKTPRWRMGGTSGVGGTSDNTNLGGGSGNDRLGGGGADYSSVMGGSEWDKIKAVHMGMESGGRHHIMGPVHRPTGDRPYGRYQVMGANIPSWTKAALGYSMTPQEFLNDPAAQEKVYEHRMGGYIQKYGLRNAFSRWHSGVDYDTAISQGRADVNMSTKTYVDRLINQLTRMGVNVNINNAPGTNVTAAANMAGYNAVNFA